MLLTAGAAAAVTGARLHHFRRCRSVSRELEGAPDALRTGQIVDLYVAKDAVKKTASRDSKNAKKKAALDDDLDDVTIRLDVLMIVVLREAPPR